MAAKLDGEGRSRLPSLDPGYARRWRVDQRREFLRGDLRSTAASRQFDHLARDSKMELCLPGNYARVRVRRDSSTRQAYRRASVYLEVRPDQPAAHRGDETYLRCGRAGLQIDWQTGDRGLSVILSKRRRVANSTLYPAGKEQSFKARDAREWWAGLIACWNCISTARVLLYTGLRPAPRTCSERKVV